MATSLTNNSQLNPGMQVLVNPAVSHQEIDAVIAKVVTRAENYFCDGYFNWATDTYKTALLSDEAPYSQLVLKVELAKCEFNIYGTFRGKGRVIYLKKGVKRLEKLLTTPLIHIQGAAQVVHRARFLLGQAYQLQGEYQKALSCFENIENSQPEQNMGALAALKRGGVHFAQKGFDRALDCYKRCIQLAETTPDTTLLKGYRDIAITYVMLGERTRAEYYLSKLCQYLDKKPSQNNIGAVIYLEPNKGEWFQQKDVDNGITLYQLISKLSKSNPLVFRKTALSKIERVLRFAL